MRSGCFGARVSRTSPWGQNAKYSLRADVFRSTLDERTSADRVHWSVSCHERSSELRQRTIPLYPSFIPSHALCFRSYNRAAARDFYTRGRDETNAHPNGRPVVGRVCHRSRGGQLADQRGEHGDRRNRADRPRSDRRNGSRLQCACARGCALSIRRIAERQSDGVRLRVRSARRPHLSGSGGSRGYSGDNGTSRQRHVERCWCWGRCLIERGLPGRDTVNDRQRRRRRSLRRHRPMLAAFS